MRESTANPLESCTIRHNLCFATLALAGLCVLAHAADAAPIHALGNSTWLKCDPTEHQTLRCDYRSSESESALTIQIDGKELQPITATKFVDSDARHAVLLLVDISGGEARASAIRTSLDHARAIAKTLSVNQTIALATFANELNILSPLGTDVAVLDGAAAEVTPLDTPTELYRVIIEALKFLGRDTAERRTLIVFSDGRAEDTAYFPDDVVAEANRQGAVIYGVGYPSGDNGAAELQTLRRLSEATMGAFVGPPPP
ncbi:MAG: vWA domain-containing protein, partial [Pseudomonadota bacterium]